MGGMQLGRGQFTVDQKGGRIALTLPSVPILNGSVDAPASSRPRLVAARPPIQGLDGEFQTKGAVDLADPAKTLKMVFVAQYFTSGKPFCQQSWNVVGPRAAAPATSK